MRVISLLEESMGKMIFSPVQRESMGSMGYFTELIFCIYSRGATNGPYSIGVFDIKLGSY